MELTTKQVICADAVFDEVRPMSESEWNGLPEHLRTILTLVSHGFLDPKQLGAYFQAYLPCRPA